MDKCRGKGKDGGGGDRDEDDKVGTDPLMVLRHFTINKKPIMEVGDLFVFGDIAYKRNAKTNFPVYKSVKLGGSDHGGGGQEDNIQNEKEKDYYTLESLKVFVKHADIPHPQYVKLAVGQQKIHPGLQLVTRPDRMHLLNYLQGRVSKCEGIDTTAPIVFPSSAPIGMKNTSSASANKGGNSALLNLTSPSYRENVLSSKPPVSISLGQSPVMKEDGDNRKVDDGSAQQTGETREILAAMGTDKILELQTKRRAVKLASISDTTLDETFGGVATILSTKDQEDLDAITMWERQHTDRNTILRAQKRDFNASIQILLQNLEAKEAREMKFGDGSIIYPKNHHVTPKIKVEPDPFFPSYSRYEQPKSDDFLETNEFGINPLMTFSRNFVEDVQRSLNEGFKEETLKRKEVEVARRPIPNNSPAKKMRRDPIPIIIVPDSPGSIISMLNCKEMLEELTFVPSEQKLASGHKKANEVIIHRIKPQSGGKTTPYKIVTFPEKLTAEEWDRVVAIFVIGKAWQFKGWPWNCNPVEICSKLNAFHLNFDDAIIEANVRSWPVKIITISRNRRHLDKAAMAMFWSTVETFITKQKPWVLH